MLPNAKTVSKPVKIPVPQISHNWVLFKATVWLKTDLSLSKSKYHSLK